MEGPTVRSLSNVLTVALRVSFWLGLAAVAALSVLR
jgi:hypothetical protein